MICQRKSCASFPFHSPNTIDVVVVVAYDDDKIYQYIIEFVTTIIDRVPVVGVVRFMKWPTNMITKKIVMVEKSSQ